MSATATKKIDSMYTSLFRELLTYMMEDRGHGRLWHPFAVCAKNIERMGDHATNIAEAVYYISRATLFANERPKADTTSGMTIEFTTSH